jgi:phosphoglycolate phosphatase-like HAD superfamily hydrolase
MWAKVGDTGADVEEGRNAGVWTLSVVTGTQGHDALAAARPDFILDSVVDLPSLLQVGASGPGTGC